MPYIIRTGDLTGLYADFLKEIYKLESIWDDRQYQYFLNHYAEPLARDLKDMEDRINFYKERIYDKQMKLESLQESSDAIF